MLRFPAHLRRVSLAATSFTASFSHRFPARQRQFHNTTSFFKSNANKFLRILEPELTDTVSSETEAIKSLFKSYESALRNSSTSQVLPLYAPTGIFMAQHFPTAAGAAAVKAAYDKVFDMIVLTPTFQVHEVEVFTDEWAFARTSSAGSTKIKATGKMIKEANQELFVLQKVDGEWKIARYCFCTVLPPGET